MKSITVVLLLIPLAASAATITVNTTLDNTTAGDGRCTLREAITNVNAATDTTGGDCTAGTGTGDTINFNVRVPGTMRRDKTLGQLVIQQDVAIMGAANAALRITGAGKSRVFEIAAGTTQMSGVSIVSGRADQGAGILVDNGATLNLEDCKINSNRATLGGGILSDGGMVTATGCTFAGNRVNNSFGDGQGGAVYNGGIATFSGCTVKGNRARGRSGNLQGGGQGYGGGIYNAGGLGITGCLFSRNGSIGSNSLGGNGGGGGGLYNLGTAVLTQSTFSHNTTTNIGGGIFDTGTGTLDLADSTLTGNTARAGGGIESDTGRGLLTNCSLVGNRAIFGGGGVNAYGATVVNCTITGNKATGRGGGSGFGGGIAGLVTVINTMIVGNTATYNPNCDDVGITDGGHNIDDGSICGFRGAGCANASGSSFCNTNAQLDPAGLKDNGGPTQTIALCTAPGFPGGCVGASPAIDAGDDSVTGPPDNLTTDQRGLPRLSGAHVDIGAYEVQ